MKGAQPYRIRQPPEGPVSSPMLHRKDPPQKPHLLFLNQFFDNCPFPRQIFDTFSSVQLIYFKIKTLLIFVSSVPNVCLVV